MPSRTRSISHAASANSTDAVISGSSELHDVDPSKNAFQQTRFPRVLPDGTTTQCPSPKMKLPPQLLAQYPLLGCGIAGIGSSPNVLKYPEYQFTPNTRHQSSIAGGRTLNPRIQKVIGPPRTLRREVVDLTKDSRIDDLKSNTPQPKIALEPRSLTGDFAMPTAVEQTRFLRCSLRLDGGGPPADLDKILSLTLEEMGRFGRFCLDSVPATRGFTFHVCRDIDCEQNCQREKGCDATGGIRSI